MPLLMVCWKLSTLPNTLSDIDGVWKFTCPFSPWGAVWVEIFQEQPIASMDAIQVHLPKKRILIHNIKGFLGVKIGKEQILFVDSRLKDAFWQNKSCI